ncbi:MAG: hypothetical protein GF398_07030 [Chitinivibrionales bacterium]|nr:hypothetical protein [Chitinivibrionales bacterium]
MKQRLMSLICAGILVIACIAQAKPYKELTPKFNRKKSLSLVRVLQKPTMANLDYAAYDKNPIRYDPKKLRPKKPGEPVTIDKLTFNGALSGAVNSLKETPLTAEEKEQPLAWKPLKDLLWKEAKDPGFEAVTNNIEGNKWGDHEIIAPFQEIATAWLHEADGEPEIWVKVEFKPWVKFLEGITDEDTDGFKEVFGKLDVSAVKQDAMAKAIEFIKNDYTKKVLNREEITDWIMILASYWYPTYNTDVIDMGDETTWPTKDTDRKTRKKLKDVTVENPVAVVRGNPFGKKIYMVFAVEGMKAEKKKSIATKTIEGKKMDTTVSENFKDNNTRFKQELEANGGSYAAWAEKVKPYIDAQKNFLAQLPEGQLGFGGKEDWIFFRKSFEYTTAGDLAEQARDKNPLPHLSDFKKYLSQENVNLLFVVVPTKGEVYYEKLPFDMPDKTDVIINPYGRKLLKDAQEAGVEVIDLLPHYLAAKAEDADSAEHLYQHQDTHWTNRGLQIAATAIADRIKQYSWYVKADQDKVDYTVRDTTFERTGDIVDKMPESERTKYPAVELEAERVYTEDGKPLKTKSNKNAPIILAGDSFTGVFEAIDCKSAGVGSHMAAKTGLPVEVITSWGGGPLVRRKMLRARADDLGAKRLVVYLMVARDLYDYSQGWADLEVPQK